MAFQPINENVQIWYDSEEFSKYSKLRFYLHALANTAFTKLEEMDQAWARKSTIGASLGNISVLDGSKDSGALESALDSLDYMVRGNRQEDKSRKLKLLDMGANTGDFLLLVSLLFPQLDLYGIELQPGAVDQYNYMYENLTNAEYPSEISDLLAKLKTQSPPKITAGNFFGNKVNEFNARYKEEVIWGTSKKDIDGIANDEGAYTIEQYLEKFPDPYKTLGYEISDFDVINAYQFKINTPAVIDYLANSCKKGARIIMKYIDWMQNLLNTIISK